jgi:hypothetical protein
LLPILAAAAITFPAAAWAEKFKRAEVTKVVNEVNLLTGTDTSRPASRGSIVSGSTAVRTGQKSRTELQFPDESVVRLGSNSVFSFLQGKREVDLGQGTLLLQVPKSLGRTRVKTAAISAAITGTTILCERVPAVLDRHGEIIKPARIKLIVIEGSLELSLNHSPEKVLKLFAGDMVAFSEDAEELPQKFKIDIEHLTRTSLLMNGGMGQLPDLELVDAEIVTQDGEKRDGELLVSNNAGTQRRHFLARFLPGKVISHARDVLNGRPQTVLAPAQRRARTQLPEGNSSPPAVDPPPGIQLPDRPDRIPPGGAPN